MVPEAPLRKTEAGLVPEGDGWFVVNAREALWREGDFGAYTRFQGDAGFEQLGINIGGLQPGRPSGMYHGEDNQEDFLVLRGGRRHAVPRRLATLPAVIDLRSDTATRPSAGMRAAIAAAEVGDDQR